MSIIDPAITYTFFYALPSALLLLYFLPFIKELYHKRHSSINLFIKIFWIPFAAVVCLSGPLNPGIVLIFSMMVLMYNFIKNYSKSSKNNITKKIVDSLKTIRKSYWFYLLPVIVLSFYSLYIGRFNSINIINHVPISQLYLKLPRGIYYQFTHRLCFPILFAIITLNLILIKKYYYSPEGAKLIMVFKWLGIFSILYLLLLPLGGYRVYRPNILRYDTIIPITLSLIFIFGATTLYIIKQMKINHKILYIPLIVCILVFFTYSDKPEFNKNQCQRIALKEIAESKEQIVELKNNCVVLSWEKVNNPEDTEFYSHLLIMWRITNEKKLFYNK